MRGNFKTDRRGKNNPNYKDGRKNTRLYRIWKNIKTRCCNNHSPQYINYGGRGITMCEDWKNNFKAFYDWSISNGYTDELTIDRIDNNAEYSPSNCRWVTMAEQCSNRRNNHIVTIGGQKKTLVQWSKQFNINYHTVQDRLKRGWNEIDALTIPVQSKFRKKVVA